MVTYNFDLNVSNIVANSYTLKEMSDGSVQTWHQQGWATPGPFYDIKFGIKVSNIKSLIFRYKPDSRGYAVIYINSESGGTARYHNLPVSDYATSTTIDSQGYHITVLDFQAIIKADPSITSLDRIYFKTSVANDGPVYDYIQAEVIYLDDKIRRGIEDLDAVYNAGYAAGQKDGGESDSEMDALLAVAPFLTKASAGYGISYSCNVMSSGAFGSLHVAQCYWGFLAFLPFITEISEGYAFGTFGVNNLIFTSKVPPIFGRQEEWVSYPPKAIFVPDESIDAYKTATNLAEFAHLMKPLSEYRGEGYYDTEEVEWR